MRRILLVLEDYSEMVFIETFFKKVGFDCLGIQNDSSFSDKLLEFSPELVIANGKGRKVNGLKLAQKTRRNNRGFPKFILLTPPSQPLTASDLASVQLEGWVESPVQPRELLRAVCQIGGLNPDSFLEKLDKLGLFEGTTQKEVSSYVAGKGGQDAPQYVMGPAPTPEEKPSSPENGASVTDMKSWKARASSTGSASAAKLKKAAELLDQLPPSPFNGIDHQEVLNQVKEFRERENDPEIKEIDRERQAFVRALFKKD